MIGGERVGAVLVAAGRSTRMGFDKLWADLGDRPVLAWSLETLAACSALDRLVVVCGPERATAVSALVDRLVGAVSPVEIVAGGERRRDSVAAGLDAIGDCAWALVHDAARPFLDVRVIGRGLAAVRQTGACVAALPARDTIKRVMDGNVVETLPRDQLWTIQTPQLFRRDLVLAALAATGDDVTDEAALVERAGGTVRVFEGDVLSFKITAPGDLDLARAVLSSRVAAGRP